MNYGKIREWFGFKQIGESELKYIPEIVFSEIEYAGEVVLLYEIGSRSMGYRRILETYISRHDLARNASVASMTKDLLEGCVILLKGDFEIIVRYVNCIFRILKTMQLPEKRLLRILSLLVVRIDNAALTEINEDVLAVNVPVSNHLAKGIINISKNIPVFAPILFFSKHIFYKDFLSKYRYSFFNEERPYFNIFDNSEMTILPGVLVPDDRISILLWAAYFSTSLPFRKDVENKMLLEPCTGSGILSMTLAKFHPKHIVATDIHLPSVNCSKINVERNKLTKTIKISHSNGLVDCVFGETIIANPPWFSTTKQDDENFLRCFLDNNYSLLKSLLSDGHERTNEDGVFYLILGEEDPFSKGNINYVDLKKIGWQIDESLSYISFSRYHRKSERQTKLIRLIKVAKE